VQPEPTSHRPPLFSLRGFIELLTDEELDESTRGEFLETMREQVDRLQRLFLVGTRLSLATVVPIAAVLILMAGPLIRAWVGPGFDGSVIVVQLLASIVVVRVGTATASTLLKGAGRHRLVAVVNVVTAIVNVSLSIALVKPLGLAGVAIGTLVPVSAAAIFEKLA